MSLVPNLYVIVGQKHANCALKAMVFAIGIHELPAHSTQDSHKLLAINNI